MEAKGKKGLGKAGAWPTRKEENEHAQKWKRMKSRTCMAQRDSMGMADPSNQMQMNKKKQGIIAPIEMEIKQELIHSDQPA
jgi:hypothetical protein